MTDEQRPMPGGSAAWTRGMTSRRMSRRQMIRYAGVSVGTLSLASILAACGGDEEPGAGAGNGATEPAGTMPDYSAPPGDRINFSNWPLYIDKARDKETGERYIPSLRMFEEETGITVNYNEEINDNAQFFGELEPQLSAGQDTGRDIIVITNGREFAILTQNGWVYELDPNLRPNFDANAADWAKDPAFDPGNKFSMAWQSGLTGIGYNTDLVSGPLTKADDLMNPDLVGTESVGLIQSDAPDFAMIQLGIDPTTSGPAEWQEAADWLRMVRDAPTFRTAYDQSYIDDMVAENISAWMGWSGDVLYYALWENYPFEFIVPEGGALLWIDNMMIPANASNPQGAYTLMDYYYQPQVAQLVTEWVLYMSPVPEVQQLIAEHAEQESGGFAESLRQTAENPLLWPDAALLEQVSFGRQLTTDDEAEEWDDIFNPIWEGA
jgi:spermidine/putrescine transport system substrate-binding protein